MDPPRHLCNDTPDLLNRNRGPDLTVMVSNRFNPDLSGWKPEVEFVRERLRALMVFSRFNPDLSGWKPEVEFVRERLRALMVPFQRLQTRSAQFAW